MSKIYLAIFALLILFSGCTPAHDAVFVSSLTEAKQYAKEYNRPIFMQVTGEDCVPCHQMERETLTEARQKELATRFIYFDCDYHENEALMSDMGIDSMPVSMVLDQTGTVIAANRGYMNTIEFNAWIESY